MTYIRFIFLISILSLLNACNSPEKMNEQQDQHGLTGITEKDTTLDSSPKEPDTAIAAEIKNTYSSVPDTGFVVMNNYASGFFYDMKYATDDNFLKESIYDCDLCMLRKEVADALKHANERLYPRGLGIKFYDCYRPLDVQKHMWKIYPNPRYLANPYTSGSNHNRGGAVDITLVDLQGQELAMGTGFDHFGKEAHHAYTNLPDTMLANRQLLKETMEAYGFTAITSEWWHYNFKAARKYSLSNFNVACD